MGIYLSEPDKEKHSTDGTFEKLSYGASSMQGWRVVQEDTLNCIVDYDKDTSFFAVYDGHGGAEVAQYCSQHLPDFIREMPHYKEGDLIMALEKGFLEFDLTLKKPEVMAVLKEMAGVTDPSVSEDRKEATAFQDEAVMRLEDLHAFRDEDKSDKDEADDNDDRDNGEEKDREKEQEDYDEIDEATLCKHMPGQNTGCAAIVAILRGSKLYVANVGVSRCVVSQKGTAIEMSSEHKAEDEPERRRIIKAGGVVCEEGRINNGLNISRTIGDHAYKRNPDLPQEEQMIIALPFIKTLDIDPKKEEFMVLACDGIWNSMTSQEVVDFVQTRIVKSDYSRLSLICEEMFEHCLAPDTLGDGTGCDNMTCIIVKFHDALSSQKQ